MQLIDKDLLDLASGQAKVNERLRINYNFHESGEAMSQRLLNALEPGSILPVHRHPHTAETYIVLRGKLRVLFFDAAGCRTEEAVLDPLVASYGVNIPAGQWHSIEVLQLDTVIFECKDGPYTPLSHADVL
jgi:cupin fold WbuC family metalloprotein